MRILNIIYFINFYKTGNDNSILETLTKIKNQIQTEEDNLNYNLKFYNTILYILEKNLIKNEKNLLVEDSNIVTNLSKNIYLILNKIIEDYKTFLIEFNKYKGNNKQEQKKFSQKINKILIEKYTLLYSIKRNEKNITYNTLNYHISYKDIYKKDLKSTVNIINNLIQQLEEINEILYKIIDDSNYINLCKINKITYKNNVYIKDLNKKLSIINNYTKIY
jgi:hypothetical protein